MTKKSFGQIIRTQRYIKGYTSGRAFARLVGISHQLLSRIEHDKETACLSEEKILRIAALLALNPDQLLAMNNKVAKDVIKILLKKPKEMSALLRRVQNASVSNINAINHVNDVTQADDLTFYPLARISHENHTAVIGETGSGKSLLTKFLIHSYFSDAENICVYDSDAAPRDWSHLKVIGNKGNYSDIAQEMHQDLTELQQRTQHYGDGYDVGGEWVRVIEEYPSTIAELSELNEAIKTVGGYPDIGIRWLRKLLRRGRKYRMKVFAVAQEFEVNAWKIAGEGGLRKAFTVLYLGATAYQTLQKIRDKELRERLRSYFDQIERPCLVDVKGRYFPADIPDLSQFVMREKNIISPNRSFGLV